MSGAGQYECGHTVWPRKLRDVWGSVVIEKLSTSELVALVVGGLTILATGIGAGIALQARATGGEGDIAVTETVTETVTEIVTEVRTEAAPSASEPVGSESVEVIEPEPAAIFRQTNGEPVTFAKNYGIDLDSQAPNWDVGELGTDLQLYQHSSGLNLFVASNTVALMDKEPSYEDCANETVLRDSLEPEHIAVGRRFCAQSSDGRWASVTIVGLDRGRERISLDIVVWTLGDS